MTVPEERYVKAIINLLERIAESLEAMLESDRGRMR
jgi:hypothetical protein